MKQYFGVLWRVVVAWIGIVGSAASIYSIRNDIVAAFKNDTLLKFLGELVRAPAFWVPAIASIPLIVCAVIIRMNLRKRGKVSLRKFLRRLNPVVFARVSIQIHHLEHIYQELIAIVFAQRAQHRIFHSEEFRDTLFRYLNQCKLILDLSTGADNAVHIKLFEHRTSPTNKTASLKKAVLRTYVRAPSRRECVLVDQQVLRPRESSELFRIIPGKPGLASNMLKNKDRYMSARYRHCSAYNHAFSDPEHFFLCNDIPALTKKGHFFSTSADFASYYNSVGVFLINRHVAHGHALNHEPVWGLFIIDSYATGIYEKFITKYLAGYMAHRCDGLFEHAEHVGAVRV